MLKLLFWIIGILFLLYAAISLFFYLFQERLIFYPTKLSSDVEFSYTADFEDYYIEVEEGVRLHGLLFKAPSDQATIGCKVPDSAALSGTASAGTADSRTVSKNSVARKGLVFYLHGNAGALDTWGFAADVFLEEGYDVFILDYRGYGKSEGEIRSKTQFYTDVEKAWQEMAKQYAPEKMIITGFSIGTGAAAWLASRHPPRRLILQAPYYSLNDLARHHFPILPAGLLLKYNFKTWQYLQEVEAPVVLLHGTEDDIIPYKFSERLKEHLKKEDQLYLLEGLGHNNLSTSQAYRNVMKEVLHTRK